MDREHARMTTLICFGFGYCAEHFVAAYGRKFDRIIGTVRGSERAAILNAYGADRLQALAFDGVQATAELNGAVAEADHILISVPTAANGDPVLAVFGEALAQAKQVRVIVYLSTIGVYGDRGGAWVDEATESHPEA